MFTSSLASLSFASIFSVLPPPEINSADIASGTSVVRHNSPAIAGLWELDVSNPSIFDDTMHVINTHSETHEVSDAATFTEDGKTRIYIADQVEGANQQSGAGITITETIIVVQGGIATTPQADDFGKSNNFGKSKNTDELDLAATATNNEVCRERYNFAADTNMWTVSGAEWSSGEYIVQPISNDDIESLPLLVMKTLYDNNKPDCSNTQEDQTGDILAVYLNYQPNEQRMSWCVDSQGEQCIMHFKRILP